MRTKKLFIGLLVGALLFNTASIESLAAENENNVEQSLTVQAEATLEQNTTQADKIINNEINSVEISTEESETKENQIGKESIEEETEVQEKQEVKEEKQEVKEEKQEVKVLKEKKEKKIIQKKVKTVKAAKEKKASYSKSDLKYLACVIYTESGNQSRTGKIAVGNVVLNRVSSNLYKDTIYGVIHQPSQFGVVRNGSFASAVSRYESGRFNSSSEKASIEAAKAALEGENIVGKRLSFTRYSSSLARRHPSGVKIQDHYFY